MADIIVFTALSSFASLVTSIAVLYRLMVYKKNQTEKYMIKSIVESEEFEKAVIKILATSNIYKKVNEIDKKLDEIKIAICISNEKIKNTSICKNE